MTARWRLTGGLVATALVGAVLLLGQAAGAQEDPEVLVELTGLWHIGEDSFWFGQPGDVPLFADWDGDGTATAAVWRNGHMFIRGGENFWFGQAGDVPYATQVGGGPDGAATLAVIRDGVVYGRNSNTTGPADFEVVIGTSPIPQPIRQPWTLVQTDLHSALSVMEVIDAYPRSPLVPWPIRARIGASPYTGGDNLVFPENTLISGTISYCRQVELHNSSVENATFRPDCGRKFSVLTHGDVHIVSSFIDGPGSRGGVGIRVVDGSTWIEDSIITGTAGGSTGGAAGVVASGELHLIDSEVRVSTVTYGGATALSLGGPSEIIGSTVVCFGGGRCTAVWTSSDLIVEDSIIENVGPFSGFDDPPELGRNAIRVSGTGRVAIISSELHSTGPAVRVHDDVVGDVTLTDTLLDGDPVVGHDVTCSNVTDRAGTVHANSCPGVDPSPEVVLVSPYGEWLVLAEDGSDGTFWYGMKGDQFLLGDWDGDGFTTPGIYRPSELTAYLTNTMPSFGTVANADPELVFSIGAPGDQVFVGDWDGNGTDTFATYSPEVAELSVGCAWFHQGQTSPSARVDNTPFEAGEVITVDFTANAPAIGELTITAGQFQTTTFTTMEFPDTITYTFDGTEVGAAVSLVVLNGTATLTATCDRPPPAPQPLLIWNSNSGGEPDDEGWIDPLTRTRLVGGDPDGDGQDEVLKLRDPEDSIVFFGDWDGNGTDTYGEYLGSQTYVVLKNGASQDPVDIRYQWGRDGMFPLAGTWR